MDRAAFGNERWMLEGRTSFVATCVAVVMASLFACSEESSGAGTGGGADSDAEKKPPPSTGTTAPRSS
ncbi:MAG: hypothetical protein BGO98_01585 [Myxococcales bacterium 68-20]|nr:hypothetical protein [Myxococcales bacterium]OJY19963.1 MAG: hypothetical protein BGO98_01585 [Myxococcales bacterium 68-20]